MLMPRQVVPVLQIPTLAQGLFTPADDAATNFILVVFYRGLHCFDELLAAIDLALVEGYPTRGEYADAA